MQFTSFSTVILLLTSVLSANAIPVFVGDSLNAVELHHSGPFNSVSLEARASRPVRNKPLPEPKPANDAAKPAPKTGLLDKIKNIFSRDIDGVLEARANRPVRNKPLPAPKPANDAAKPAPKAGLLDKIKNIFSRHVEVESKGGNLMR